MSIFIITLHAPDHHPEQFDRIEVVERLHITRPEDPRYYSSQPYIFIYADGGTHSRHVADRTIINYGTITDQEDRIFPALYIDHRINTDFPRNYDLKFSDLRLDVPIPDYLA